MNIERLLECSVSELEKMTDGQLLAHLQPYLHCTRPELIDKSRTHKVDKRKSTVDKQQQRELDMKMNKLLALAEAKFGKDGIGV